MKIIAYLYEFCDNVYAGYAPILKMARDRCAQPEGSLWRETPLSAPSASSTVDGLLPCPFCGSEATGDSLGVHCANADCLGHSICEVTDIEWNTRAPQPVQTAVLTDEEIIDHAKNYCVFDVNSRTYDPLCYDSLEDIINMVRDTRATPESIHLSPAEIQSGCDRVKWAKLLIKQLPEDHDGRNSWLLNYQSMHRPSASTQEEQRPIPFKEIE